MPERKKTPRRERRRTARADAKLSMRVEGDVATPRPSAVVTESQNISSNGVYCHSPHYLAPLSKVALTIVLPRLPGDPGPHRMLKCEGVVVRCMAAAGVGRSRTYELACSFLELAQRDRAVLDAFVTWRNLELLRRASQPPAARRPAARRKTPARRGTGSVAARVGGGRSRSSLR